MVLVKDIAIIIGIIGFVVYTLVRDDRLVKQMAQKKAKWEQEHTGRRLL